MNFRVIIDCPDEIPCNPCETVCPNGLIHVGDDIASIPAVSSGTCTGCGRCIAICPGLAIRVIGSPAAAARPADVGGHVVIDSGPSDGKAGMATLLIPHEYLPLPPVDTRVALADRTGHRIGEGRVLRHARPLRDDPTVVLHIETSPDLAEQACGLYLQNSPDRATQDVGVDIGSIAGDTTSGSVAYASGDDRIICRCENTNLGSIKQAILSGARTLDEVKRRTRSGMGLCGGRNCGKLIAGIMADMLADDGGYRALPVQPLRVRPPVVPVSVAELAEVKPGSNQMTDLGPTR